VQVTKKKAFAFVYEKNELSRMNHRHSTCHENSNKAFRAAFDIYNCMISASIMPDQGTFRNLFAACMLPIEDADAFSRQKELVRTVIVFASDYGMDTTEMIKQLQSFQSKRK
jgi:hypothetical protein